MFLDILFFPITLVVIYLLPYLGVTFSVKNNKKWLAYWLVTLFAQNIIACILSWFL